MHIRNINRKLLYFLGYFPPGITRPRNPPAADMLFNIFLILRAVERVLVGFWGVYIPWCIIWNVFQVVWRRYAWHTFAEWRSNRRSSSYSYVVRSVAYEIPTAAAFFLSLPRNYCLQTMWYLHNDTDDGEYQTESRYPDILLFLWAYPYHLK